MPRRQSQSDRQAVRVYYRMYLCCRPASGSPQILVGAMLDAVGVLRRLNDRAVDHLNINVGEA